MESTSIALPDQLPKGVLALPGTIDLSFRNTETETTTCGSGEEKITFHGILYESPNDRICPHCNGYSHIKGKHETTLKHVNSGRAHTELVFKVNRYRCSKCNATYTQKISFKSDNHFITKKCEEYIYFLLNEGKHTISSIAKITGVCKNIIRDLDFQRLYEKYMEDGIFKKPDWPVRRLAVDEFLLSEGHVYATHIIDYDTRRVIWIYPGKSKDVLFNFMDFVGDEFMNNITAIACDMNANYGDAVKSRYEHIDIVYDKFHIHKYLNEKVIDAIRKVIYKQLMEQGKVDEAKSLKHCKYLLCSSNETLSKREKLSKEKTFKTNKNLPLVDMYNKTIEKNKKKIKKSAKEKYQEILKTNEIFVSCDFVKESVTSMYKSETVEEMTKKVTDIINFCDETKNEYFKKFSNLLLKGKERIISYAKHRITSSVIEGVNNKIKTLRRMAYGYRDMLYFFLKIMDSCGTEAKRRLFRTSQTA